MMASYCEWAGSWFRPVFQISLQASLIALLIFTIQFLAGRHLSARWKYALWFLMVVRLLMPLLPESPLSWQRLWQTPKSHASAIGGAGVPVLESIPPSTPPVPAPTAPTAPPELPPLGSADPKPVDILGAIWLAGVALFLAAYIALYGKFRWALRKADRCGADSAISSLLSECAQAMKIRHQPEVLLTSLVSTPAIFGIFRPALLLPRNFETAFSRNEQRMVILHELAHVRRGDLLLNPVLVALQIVHWFNPLLALAFRRLRFDRECATDSLVLAGDRIRLKADYGETLLKLVQGAASPSIQRPILGILENKAGLRERFRGIHRTTAAAYRFSIPAVALIAVLGIATLTQPTVTASENPAKPELSPSASKDEVRRYVAGILKDTSVFANSSLQDPQIAELKKVGPENIDVLIAENARHTTLGQVNPTTNYYLSMAIRDLARPEDKKIVTEALPKNRYLVYTVVKMGWAPEVREELLRVFREEPGRFSPGWIEAIASLRDPSTYAELKEYLINGKHREHTYKALKTIPDIGDLKETVAQAWKVSQTVGSNEERDMAKIAVQYELPGAAEYLRAHPQPAATKAAVKNDVDFFRTTLEGARLTSDQARELEQKIAEDPNNLTLRLKIVGYFFFQRSRNPAAQNAAQPHILWVITHAPDSPAHLMAQLGIDAKTDPTHYAEASQAWLEQAKAHSGHAAVLANAANFFQLQDPQQAEKLFLQAQALDPSNATLTERLATFYFLQAVTKPNPKFPQAAQRALRAYEVAIRGQSGARLFYLLTLMTKVALPAEENEKARAYATQLLEMAPAFRSDWNYGNAIYTANATLGLIAHTGGDPASAEKFLLAAGSTTGSPQLNSFGPDLTLAQQLLAAGKTETVIAFLDKISTFWKGRETRIQECQEAIRQGQKPNLSQIGPQSGVNFPP